MKQSLIDADVNVEQFPQILCYYVQTNGFLNSLMHKLGEKFAEIYPSSAPGFLHHFLTLAQTAITEDVIQGHHAYPIGGFMQAGLPRWLQTHSFFLGKTSFMTGNMCLEEPSAHTGTPVETNIARQALVLVSIKKKTPEVTTIQQSPFLMRLLNLILQGQTFINHHQESQTHNLSRRKNRMRFFGKENLQFKRIDFQFSAHIFVSLPPMMFLLNILILWQQRPKILGAQEPTHAHQFLNGREHGQRRHQGRRFRFPLKRSFLREKHPMDLKTPLLGDSESLEKLQTSQTVLVLLEENQCVSSNHEALNRKLTVALVTLGKTKTFIIHQTTAPSVQENHTHLPTAKIERHIQGMISISLPRSSNITIFEHHVCMSCSG